MARCASCGTTILFGGVKSPHGRFCNQRCVQTGYITAAAAHIPPEVIEEQTLQLHAGACPRCGGPGPVDIHTAYFVWSLLVLTSWRNTPAVSCRRCGRGRQVGNMLTSALVGWWGFPWGIVMTPVQVTRNLIAIFGGPDPSRPSDDLRRAVRTILGSQLLAAMAAEHQEAGATPAAQPVHAHASDG